MHHGTLRVVISDCGRQFTADIIEEHLWLCGSAYHSTPYHTQINGFTEWTNQTYQHALNVCCH